MDSSSDFTALTSLSRKVCVCGGESKTVKFGIKPTKLGKIDLTVQARSYGASTQYCDSDTVSKNKKQSQSQLRGNHEHSPRMNHGKSPKSANRYYRKIPKNR